MRSIGQRKDVKPAPKGSQFLLFKLGSVGGSGIAALFGIPMAFVREIVAIPKITPVVGYPVCTLGVVNLRDQLMPVFDLPTVVGCVPSKKPSLMLVVEFNDKLQAFSVESVDDLLTIEDTLVVKACNNYQGLVSHIARLEGNAVGCRLAQILDVSTILQQVGC